MNGLDLVVGEKVATESLAVFNGLSKRASDQELVALATVAEPLKQYLLDIKHPVIIEQKRKRGRPKKITEVKS